MVVGQDLIVPRPGPEERAEELRQRAEDLQAQKTRLAERLQRRLQDRSQLVEQLEAVRTNRGITEVGYLFRLGEDLDSLIENRPIAPSFMEAMKHLQAQLAERGTDLILMPIPHQGIVYAHRMQENLDAKSCIHPAYTEGLIQLIDAGIEVVDVLDEFRAFEDVSFPEHPGTKAGVLHPGDHHWTSAGMDLGNKILAERLQRYAFCRSYFQRAEFSPSQGWTKAGLATSLVGKNKIPRESKQVNYDPAWGLPRFQMVYDRKYQSNLNTTQSWEEQRAESKRLKKLRSPPMYPIYITGDSMCYHKSGGTMTSFFSANTGLPRGMAKIKGKKGGSNKGSFLTSMALHSQKQTPPWPRVMVFVYRMGPMFVDEWPKVELPALAKKAQAPGPFGKQLQNLPVTLTEVSETTPPNETAYAEAMTVMVATVNAGPHKGKKVLLHLQSMKEFKLLPAAHYRVGEKLIVSGGEYDQLIRQDKELAAIQTFDDTMDFTSPRFIVTEHKPQP